MHELAPDFAEKFFGDTKVRCNQVLRHTLINARILLSKFQIAVARRQAEIPNDSLLRSHEGVLQNDAEEALHLRHPLV